MTFSSNLLKAVSTGALFVVRPELGSLIITGPDRRAWLQGILTCDLSNVETGRGAWGLLLTKQGKIVSDVNVVAAEDALYLSTAANLASEVTQYLEDFLIMEDAELDNVTAEVAWLMIHGPRALALARSAVQNGALAFGAIDWTSLGGAAVAASRGALPALVERLLAEAGTEGVLADGEAWQGLRLSSAVPEFGVDYGGADNPHEAALERRAVSFEKGCYLGQEVVCMQDMRGKVKRRVASLLIDSETAPDIGSPVESGDGQTIGEVTSAAAISGLAQVVAMARIKNPFFEPGTVVKVSGRRATVVERPLEKLQVESHGR
jgi:hypothetical protein